MVEFGQNTVSGEMLRGFIERLEHLDEEKKALADDRAAILAEAKASGFVTTGIKSILKRRAMKPSEWAEEQSLIDMYAHALGMDSELPLFKHVSMMKVDIASRESVIEAMKALVPENGSIIIDAAGGKTVRLTRAKNGTVSVSDVLPPAAPPPPPAAPSSRKSPPAEVPDVDGAAAEAFGAAAFADDVPIIKNPFPFGDARRPLWDKGWRGASGTDGMD